jgi:uncharacterized protein
MPVQPTYPGVYIEEIPSGVRTLSGVATSVAAFIGQFRRGPMDEPVQLFNLGDFERELGGLLATSGASYAIQQFFLNGGTEAWAVRTAGGTPTRASVKINSLHGAATLVMTVEAVNEGAWGNGLLVSVDQKTMDPTSLFNLRVSETGAGGRTELFRNLSVNPVAPRFVDTVVNSGSKLVRVHADPNNTTLLPQPNGTLSGAFTAALAVAASAPEVGVKIGTEGPFTAALGTTPPTDLSSARALLESAIRAAQPAAPAFAGATVEVLGNQLLVLAGPASPGARVIFSATTGDTTTVNDLHLGTLAVNNVQQYALGVVTVPAGTAQGAGVAGTGGSPPDGTALMGSLNDKTGIYALEKVDLFNILCIPDLDPNTAQAVMTVAIAYCEKRRAMFLMDTPVGKDDVQEIKDWLAGVATLRSKNAALYFPRVQVPDPLNEFRLRSFGASGTIAGLYARTDASRGVWKAPAGTEATLTNVQALDAKLSDAENGALNPLAINTLRSFPVYGNVCWGARTLVGADQMASEWKYIPVRRLALFLEESLYRGTQWVVFEPNDEPLWAQIRLNIGAFMHTLFRQGAFQGKTPRDAYLVKCDGETTTQNDINNGVVNILVGFAPLKPAEFVILQIQQLAGQIQT